MAQFLGIVFLVLGLLLAIGLHELGHLIPAKKFGVRVSQYFVGFGPTLWSKRKGETEYGLKAIPLGGFVRIIGMVPPADKVKPVRGKGAIARLINDSREDAVAELLPSDEGRAFYELSWWKKVIVMAGGPLVNLFLAIIFFSIVLVGIGQPEPSNQIGRVLDCYTTSQSCGDSDPISPAKAAGLQAGDTIVQIAGEPVDQWIEITQKISHSPNQPLAVVVERDGALVETVVTPMAISRAVTDDDGKEVIDAAGEMVTKTVGYFGIVPATEVVQQEWNAGFGLTKDYLVATTKVIVKLPEHVYHAARATLGLEDRATDSVMGIVGVGRIAGDVAALDIEGYGLKERVADLLMLLGGLNLALFAFNMIPLLPLDGGHIVGALWSGIKNGYARLRGRPKPYPVDLARQMPIAYLGFALLLIMGVILILADIVAPIQLG